MRDDDPLYVERDDVEVRFRLGPGNMNAPDLVELRLREAIGRGELRSGDRLPSRKRIAKKLGVSTEPVRMGMERLRDEGLLTGHQGARWFVA